MAESETAKEIGILSAKVEGLIMRVQEMHGRVFNGMGKEIREEVKTTIDKMTGSFQDALRGAKEEFSNDVNDVKKQLGNINRMVWAVFIGIFLAVVGFVLVDRLSALQMRVEYSKTYTAITDLQTQFKDHMKAGGPDK